MRKGCGVRRAGCGGWVCLLLVGCGGGGGAECALDTDCPTGRYCAAGACTYDCAVDNQCAQGYRCDPARGRCVEGCTRTNGGVEACDSVDNDCDALTDEDFPHLGTSCRNGGCAPGTWVCAADGLSERCSGPLPAADDPSCDGLDQDCDGATDEDAPPQACPLQLGVCLGASAACVQGAYPACDYGPSHTPDTDPTCDRLDNDCDGATDEDALLLEPEAGAQAGDGQDNNCNGLVDEPGGVLVPIPGVPGVWIDAYESTLFEHPDCTGARYGEAADDYPAGFPADGAATVSLYACSLPGLIPSGHLSYHRAERACQAQGKRLCAATEWTAACSGDGDRIFPYGDRFVALQCNDSISGPQHPTAAGGYPACASPARAQDMSGNLAEWLNQVTYDETFPGYYLVGGYHYRCELCANAVSCHPCDVTADRADLEQVLKCQIVDDQEQRFPPGTAWPTLGGRCCMDGP